MLKVYQVSDKCDWVFRSYDSAKNHGFSFDKYQLVFETDKCPNTNLEEIYMSLNAFDEKWTRDALYKMRSLSVSDIIEVNGVRYYCDDIGWEKI